jgi:hypothetical protein
MLKRCISDDAVAQHAVDEVRLFQSVTQPGWRDALQCQPAGYDMDNDKASEN